MTSTAACPPSTITLPTELLLQILEYFVDSSPRPSALPIVMLSKTIHNYLLPRFHHTLDFASDSANSFTEAVDRTRFLACSKSTSLAFVRRLKCNIYHHAFPLSSFLNVTWLALWGSQNLTDQPAVASGLMELPIRQLIVWYYRDLSTLGDNITPSSTITTTLERLTTHHSSCAEPTPKWLQCRNLTHIMVYCNNLEAISSSAISGMTTHQRLQCYSLRSSLYLGSRETLGRHLPRDRRVVILKRSSENTNLEGNNFWDENAILWNEIEERIRKNGDLSEITLAME
ncbi:hypothetical protein DL96DRAFT_1627581 [Flagelloscypha sp. PMI_526]|nr:hypothetical protein DL96DRAFT_1627581 [Flagelloscypha sp. PMI_526]